jgi:spermidine synthase
MHAHLPSGHRFAFFLIGFAPLTAQILLIRELLVVFYGNELSMGVLLSAWLLWTALGSMGLGRRVDQVADKRRLLALVQSAMAVLLLLSILYVRAAKLLWGIPAGEIADLGRMVAITFTAAAPFCVLSGYLFALGCGLHDDICGGKGRSVGAIFFMEALGAAVGGVVTTVVFFHYLNHIQAALVVALLLWASALLLLGNRSRLVSAVIFLLVLMLPVPFYWGAAIDHATRQWEWRDQPLVLSKDTPYGNLAAVSAREQISIFENGLWLFSHPDPQSAEHAVHFALLQHEAPRRVLLVGGGISSSLAEILKHPSVEKVVYVELDPAVIDFGRRLVPQNAEQVLDDPRVRLVHQDGRHYIKTATELYDVIVVDLPDPMTVQLNRFYTLEFFSETSRILAPRGVLATALTSTEYMIGPTLARMLASVKQTLREVYAEVLVYPGSTAHFFAAREPGLLIDDPVVLVDRIRERTLSLQYVQDYYLLFNLTPDKIRFLENIIGAVDENRVNRDFTPALYYDTLIHWSAQYTPRLADLLRRAERIDLGWLLFAGVGITGALALIARRVSGSAASNVALYYACFTAGYTEMTLSVLLIMTFQVLYGYVYYKIALLIAAYMIGLMIGSRYMIHRLGALRAPLFKLVAVQGGLAGYGLILWGVILAIHQLPVLSWAASYLEMGFPLWLVVAGVLGGLHFPLASHIYLARGHQTGRTAGQIYALDLAGSSLGALLAVILLLPGLGLGRTLVLLAVFNLLAAAWLAGEKRVDGILVKNVIAM